MYVTITKSVIPIKCKRCQYVWNYGGKNTYVATCPHCRTFVRIQNNRLDKTKVVEGIGFQPSHSTILTTDSTNAIDSPATEEDSLSSEPKEVSNINGR